MLWSSSVRQSCTGQCSDLPSYSPILCLLWTRALGWKYSNIDNSSKDNFHFLRWAGGMEKEKPQNNPKHPPPQCVKGQCRTFIMFLDSRNSKCKQRVVCVWLHSHPADNGGLREREQCLVCCECFLEEVRIVEDAVEHCILVLHPRKSIGNNYFAFLAPCAVKP